MRLVKEGVVLMSMKISVFVCVHLSLIKSKCLIAFCSAVKLFKHFFQFFINFAGIKFRKFKIENSITPILHFSTVKEVLTGTKFAVTVRCSYPILPTFFKLLLDLVPTLVDVPCLRLLCC